MKKLIYLFAIILLVYQPSPDSSGQSTPTNQVNSLENRNEEMKKKISLNHDTLGLQSKELQDVAKPKPRVKYRYRTKVQVVHDTVYIPVPMESDSNYVLEDCPIDTIYLPREPQKRKGFLKRLFNN